MNDVDRVNERDATIAALQARVQELEAIKIPDDAFTYCAYCGEKSPVDEHNEDLSAHIKVCPKHPIRDVESQLTQRTVELESAQREARLQKEVEAALLSKVAEYEVELNGDPQNFYGRGRTVGLRTIIAALPKVPSEYLTKEHIDVRVPILQGAARLNISDELIALWQHRQGMEG